MSPEVHATPVSPSLPATVQTAIAGMLADLELSDLTTRTYSHALKAFVRFLRDQKSPDVDPNEAEPPKPLMVDLIDEETLATYARWLRDTYPGAADASGNSSQMSRTARTYMVAARRLMNWLDLRELLPEGVSFDRMVRRIDQGRGRRRQGYQQRKVDPEVSRVLGHYIRQPLPERKGARRLALLRNRALMAMLYDTGMRIGEALALSREDVLDGRARKIRLRHTKNGKPRTVFMSVDTRRLLREYVREREGGPYTPLFASHGRDKGTAITASHAWRLVKNAAKAEGLYSNTSPHSLRHRRAQDLLDEGMPLEWVAALLGHEHPDTTRTVYAWETNEERLEDMVDTYGFSPTTADTRARTEET